MPDKYLDDINTTDGEQRKKKMYVPENEFLPSFDASFQLTLLYRLAQ